jgi:hypothetical protein
VEHAKLIVSRTSERDLKIRGIEVILDGMHVDDLAFGNRLEKEIAPGRHTLKVTNLLKSKQIEFEAAPGETIHFETIGVVLGGLWLIVTMLGTVPYNVLLEQVKAPA